MNAREAIIEVVKEEILHLTVISRSVRSVLRAPAKVRLRERRLELRRLRRRMRK